ncbi:hypothetical protein ACF09L_19015 [Streptomyces sp. NPDC014779]|uniref:DUF6197 family protein n=1 Tax=Streptomyces sp. NPDC014779 TaxID=3364911 RepID=UPI0036F92EFB
MNLTVPTNVPSGDRRTIRVDFTPARPSTVPAVLLGAARILQANGLWQGDYVPDVRDREMCVPHFLRPMSIVAAIRCAATGDPHKESQLADTAIGYVALSLDPAPKYGGIFDLEKIVEAWNDAAGRSADEAVALLEELATAPERVA